jgi:hypothetical protein
MNKKPPRLMLVLFFFLISNVWLRKKLFHQVIEELAFKIVLRVCFQSSSCLCEIINKKISNRDLTTLLMRDGGHSPELNGMRSRALTSDNLNRGPELWQHTEER